MWCSVVKVVNQPLPENSNGKRLKPCAGTIPAPGWLLPGACASPPTNAGGGGEAANETAHTVSRSYFRCGWVAGEGGGAGSKRRR